MSSIKPQTLKGFRDFLPIEARKRQYAINILKEVFESYGFEPLETPALEYEEILLGKYGDEGDKLMYRFIDRGNRKVAMRYDQTVPLARVVAQYQNELPMPFKRYQIQNVWRAENTQKGRFREFLQCDCDIVGSSSPLSDAETIKIAYDALKKLGFRKFKIFVNDRNIFSYLKKSLNLSQEQVWDAIRAIDKLKKMGRDGVINELKTKGITTEKSEQILDSIDSIKATDYLLEVMGLAKRLGLEEDFIQFYPPLARGLDYYTSTIFEIEVDGYSAGSVCGGGRYDNLIGLFADKQIPAVGFAFGFDRLIEAMDELNRFPQDVLSSTTKVLVTVFNSDLLEKSITCSSLLHSAGVSTELYLDENAKIEKQLKYADKKGIPYVVIIGPNEAAKNLLTLRNMKTREQVTITIEDAITQIKK